MPGANDSGLPLQRNRGPEIVSGVGVGREKFLLLSPACSGAREDVSGARVIASLVVVLRADQHGVPVDRHGASQECELRTVFATILC